MGQEHWHCPIPKLFPVRQRFDSPVIKDPQAKAYSLISKSLRYDSNITPGCKIALTAGSRGIGQIDEILKGVVKAVRGYKCEPIVIPSMGSHGGDDSKAKENILKRQGITEASINAPISKTAVTVLIGHAGDELPVYCQEEALSADAIIIINRIKPHTDFHGSRESGLLKMAAVGLGGEPGASSIHSKGYDFIEERIYKTGEYAVDKLNIHGGLSIIEGPTGLPLYLEYIPKEEIIPREPFLLDLARKFVPKLPFKNMDVLIIREIGKDISGTCMDPHIIGRYPSGKEIGNKDIPNIYRVAALDLTDSSYGNSAGIGLCDVTTRRLYQKTNLRAMYNNVIASKGSICAKFPMVMASDREAICVSMLTCPKKLTQIKMSIICNTLDLERFLVSAPLIPICESEGTIVSDDEIELEFDETDTLICNFSITHGSK
jgi:hypothetical protein